MKKITFYFLIPILTIVLLHLGLNFVVEESFKKQNPHAQQHLDAFSQNVESMINEGIGSSKYTLQEMLAMTKKYDIAYTKWSNENKIYIVLMKYIIPILIVSIYFILFFKIFKTKLNI